jgi:hypothetical protein
MPTGLPLLPVIVTSIPPDGLSARLGSLNAVALKDAMMIPMMSAGKATTSGRWMSFFRKRSRLLGGDCGPGVPPVVMAGAYAQIGFW